MHRFTPGKKYIVINRATEEVATEYRTRRATSKS
jgi:hypothetical protein